jgi:hypothetical protein
MFKKTISMAVACAMVSGCATNLKPAPYPKDSAHDQDSAALVASERWDDPAFRQEGKPMVVLMTPFSVPKEVADAPAVVQLEPTATVKDLAALLGNAGHSIIVADKAAGDASFYLPQYKGKLGNLLSAVSRAADVWFTWQDGVIVVSSKQRISITIPQDIELAKKLTDDLKKMGLDTALASPDAGMATFDLKRSQYEQVRAYLNRMTKNSAMVSLQIAIVTVTLNQQDSTGLDWSQLQVGIGKNSRGIFSNSTSSAASTVGGVGSSTTSGSSSTTGGSSTSSTSNNSGSTTTSGSGSTTTGNGTSTTGTDGTTTAASTLPSGLNSLMLSGSGIQLPVAIGNVFSLAGFVNFLGSYGRTDTKQDVMLKTMTGNKVELKSVTQIPYVSSVGVATTGSNTTNNSNGLLGSASTSTANDGITLKVTPTYDHSARSVALDIDLSIQSVLSFNNLSAGSQIGSFTQPTTADRSFTDILRVRPGETAVIGGLTYDAVSNNTTSPLPLRNTDWESRSLTVQRQTMFIVIRPTVRTFGAMQEKAASSRDGFDDSGDDSDDLPVAPDLTAPGTHPAIVKPTALTSLPAKSGVKQ